MARPVRGCPITRSQQEGTEQPEQAPEQEGQLDATVVTVTQVETEVDHDAESVKMEIPYAGTLCQRMMPWEKYKRIL